MQRLFLAATLALASLASGAVAQQQNAPEPQSGQGYHHGHHRHNPHKQAMKMSKQFNLSQDQTAKLEPILAARQQKIDALKADTSLTPDARRAQFRTIHEEAKQQLAGVLSPEQIAQMKSMHRHHGHHGQPSQNSAPPAA